MNIDHIDVPLIPSCSACILNSLQTLIPLLSKDSSEQHELLSLAYRKLADGYTEKKPPAPLSIELYRELYKKAGKRDPYRQIKDQSIEAARLALPVVLDRVDQYDGYSRLRASLAASIAGNFIDFNTAGHRPDLSKLTEVFEDILDHGFAIDDSEYLWQSLKSKAGQVSFLADNAGENLFDIPLLRVMSGIDWNIIYIVKGEPMVNDVTREDVEGTEIEDYAEIIDTGAWAHGVPLKWVSQEFLEAIQSSDLVISKGQANIETFPEIQREMNVETYYITRAKCAHISKAIGAKQGDNVVLRRPRVLNG